MSVFCGVDPGKSAERAWEATKQTKVAEAETWVADWAATRAARKRYARKPNAMANAVHRAAESAGKGADDG